MTTTLEDLFKKTKPGDAGIFGDPIGHSMSPIMQNAAFKTWNWAFTDRDGVPPMYHAFPVKAEELKDAINLAKKYQLRGLNITVPHKVAACSFVDSLDPFSKKIGAINTIFIERGHSKGYNTDGEGFRRAIEHHFDVDINETLIVLVLGAGGTGRVITHKLFECEAKILWWNRDQEKLKKISKETQIPSSHLTLVQSPEDLTRAMRTADLVVNATSVGLNDTDGMPAAGLEFRSDQFVYDVIYHRETQFMGEAKKAGAKVCGGLGMLINQGAKSFEIWTGSPAPKEMMWDAVKNKIQ